jgi:imidazole glycerol phosphate synthase glutamine amidotransferase subunit
VTSASTVALIDYGAGNVPSVERALQKLGVTSKRVTRSSEFAGVHAVVLPGVGHYAAIIRALDEHNLRGALLGAIERGVPFLGICLGLQALYSSSEEASSFSGLNLFSGSVRSLPVTVKLPHMGWNRLHIQRTSQLLAGLSDSDYFYFAHSYAAAPSPGSNEVVATCSHGATFTAILEHKNIFATQFHPEKSGAAGARLLQNFLSLAARMSDVA